MNQSMPPKPPFLSNSLRMPDEEGLYLFLVDTLVVPSGQGGEVRKHEVAHRVLSHFSMGNTTFGVIRDLVGMSHVLLWMAVSNAFYNKVSIQGNKFGELHISGGTPTARSEIETLFSRVEYIEHFIDQAWTRLEPIAEMAAIDFSEGVGDEERSWLLSRATELPSQQPASTIEKDRLFKAMIEHFGIYKEALWKAWTEYQKIKSDLARKELLRVCMSLLYLEDDVGIHVKDPIEIMLNRAPFAQQQGESARYMFFYGTYVDKHIGDGIN
jgi:hypothetical protein